MNTKTLSISVALSVLATMIVQAADEPASGVTNIQSQSQPSTSTNVAENVTKILLSSAWFVDVFNTSSKGGRQTAKFFLSEGKKLQATMAFKGTVDSAIDIEISSDGTVTYTTVSGSRFVLTYNGSGFKGTSTTPWRTFDVRYTPKDW